MTLTTYFIIGFVVACLAMAWLLADGVRQQDAVMLPIAFLSVAVAWPVFVLVTLSPAVVWFIKLGWAILRGRVDQ